MLRAYRHVPSFQAVEAEASDILVQLKEKLRARLNSLDSPASEVCLPGALSRPPSTFSCGSSHARGTPALRFSPEVPGALPWQLSLLSDEHISRRVDDRAQMVEAASLNQAGRSPRGSPTRGPIRPSPHLPVLLSTFSLPPSPSFTMYQAQEAASLLIQLGEAPRPILALLIAQFGSKYSIVLCRLYYVCCMYDLCYVYMYCSVEFICCIVYT